MSTYLTIMEIIQEYAPAIGVTFTIILGWSLNEFTGYAKVRRNEKQITNVAIFYIGQAVDFLTMINSQKYISAQIIKSLKDDFPEVNFDDKALDDLNRKLQSTLINIQWPVVKVSIADLKGGYEDSLISLAKIDPLSAVKLSGLHQTLNQIEDIFNPESDVSDSGNNELVFRTVQRIVSQLADVGVAISSTKTFKKRFIKITKDPINYEHAAVVIDELRKTFYPKIKQQL